MLVVLFGGCRSIGRMRTSRDQTNKRRSCVNKRAHSEETSANRWENYYETSQLG